MSSFDKMGDMWDLVRMRRMLSLFRKVPYNGPNWHINKDTQQINWSVFSGTLHIETYFLEDWRYELLNRFFPFIFQRIHFQHYKNICERRIAKIDRLIERAEKLELIKIIPLTPNSVKLDTKIQLTSGGIDFVDNPSDFLNVFFSKYSPVATFLIGLIPTAAVYLLIKLPPFIFNYLQLHNII
jgi:hypothetical protein